MENVTIIGAGPAGLATAARLNQAGIYYNILEASDQVGVRWAEHYDRLCLHTVKELSSLPHMPFPDDYPRYVPRQEFLEYLQAYAHKFEIQPEFNCHISSISATVDGWSVISKDGRQWNTKEVVVATGANRIPFQPEWPGMQEFEGSIIHSRSYKNPNAFEGKSVLIVGMGNTGAEIALDLANHGVDTAISVRSPINIVPRDLFGRPVQLTAKKLEKFPFRSGEWIGAQIRKIYFGNLRKYNIPLSKQYPVDQLKTTGKTPVIDLGTIDMIKKGKIRVIEDIKSLNRTGVTTLSGTHIRCDVILCATGYRPCLTEMINGIESHLDEHGMPSNPIGSGQVEGMYFVGFDNYKLGGILGTIISDSKTVVDHIRNKI